MSAREREKKETMKQRDKACVLGILAADFFSLGVYRHAEFESDIGFAMLGFARALLNYE